MTYRSDPKNTFSKSFVLAAITLSLSLAATIPSAHAGGWRWSGTFDKTSANHILVAERNWSDFHKTWVKNEKNGFRLFDFEVQNNVVKYSGVFRKSKLASAAKIKVSLAALKKDWKDYAKKGYVLQDFETWTEGKKRYFGGVFHKRNAKQALWVVSNWKSFHSKWVELQKTGYRLEDFETWMQGTTQWYAGVFRGGKYPTGSSMGASWKYFKQARDKFRKDGYRLIDFEVLFHNNQPKYYGVFGKTGPYQALRVTNERKDFLKYRKDFKMQGLKIADLEITWFADPPKSAYPTPEPPKGKPIAAIFKPNSVTDQRTGLKFPSDMPAIKWPKSYKHCSSHEKKAINQAWAMGHFMMWRSHQIMEWLKRNKSKRKAAWVHGYRGRNAANSYANYSPRAWFGPYDGKRFDIARKAVSKVWSKNFRGGKIKVKCRVRGGKTGAHPCFQNNPGGNGRPAANHILKGTVNFCDKFFSPRLTGNVSKDIREIGFRARTVVHELFHHVRLSNGHYVMDTHVHCDGGRCKTEKMYGKKNSTHLSHVKGFRSGHYKRALRNNDNYAWFAYWVGRVAHGTEIPNGFGHLDQFPPKK